MSTLWKRVLYFTVMTIMGFSGTLLGSYYEGCPRECHSLDGGLMIVGFIMAVIGFAGVIVGGVMLFPDYD